MSSKTETPGFEKHMKGSQDTMRWEGLSNLYDTIPKRAFSLSYSDDKGHLFSSFSTQDFENCLQANKECYFDQLSERVLACKIKAEPFHTHQGIS